MNIVTAPMPITSTRRLSDAHANIPLDRLVVLMEDVVGMAVATAAGAELGLEDGTLLGVFVG